MINKDFQKVLDILAARQSIFPACYTGEKIPDELVAKILAAANNAPSHRHTEPWRFKVISNHKLEEFADFYQLTYKLAHQGDAFNERKYKKIRTKLAKTSHLIVICMSRDEQESLPEWEEISAVACAVQNIYLTLPALGLGGYWSTPKILLDKISEFVKLNPYERCLGLFYLGIAKEDRPPHVVKKPIEDKTTWIG